MTDKNVWFVTGAGRGMGIDIVRAALGAGHAVVATGRNTDAVAGRSATPTTCSSSSSTSPSPRTPRQRLPPPWRASASIDVLVNNAGNFYAGFFEELPAEDFRAQIETNLFGPVNVTRAVLPVMRARRRGLIVTISSTGGIAGQPFVSAYSAAKFAVEGWMESLAPEVAPFGIRTMLVEPGFFRTELLTEESTKYPEPSIDDYAEKTRRDGHRLEEDERPAGRRPRQARQGAGPTREPSRAPAALARWRRRSRDVREEGHETCSPKPTPTAALSSSLAHDSAEPGAA